MKCTAQARDLLRIIPTSLFKRYATLFMTINWFILFPLSFNILKEALSRMYV